MSDAGQTIARLAGDIERRTGGRLTAEILGNADCLIRSVAPLSTAQPDQLGFLSNSRYRHEAALTHAGAVVLSPADRALIFPKLVVDRVLIECPAPYAWFALAAQALAPAPVVTAGIASTATVDPGARIDPSASIGPHATIAAGATIGPRARIGANAVLGEGVAVGADSIVYPGVVIYADCTLGERCIVHAGAVIGADGFGFAPFGQAWIKIPQTGGVHIGDDVEIGANTTIDRGAMTDTIIEEGCKIDNQVQIGHNCRIGAFTVIAGCAGISGSVTIGRHCMIGGSVGIVGHLTIADGTVIGGATVVSRSITTAGRYSGSYPMMEHGQWSRSAALVRQLDQMRDRLRELERQLPRKETK